MLPAGMNEAVMTMLRRKVKGWRGLMTLRARAPLAAAAGWGGARARATGRVTYDDGTPVTEGNVIGHLEGSPTSSTPQGAINSDGTFSWGTEKPGDGAKPGKYKVAVIPRALGDAEKDQGKLPAVDPKYSDPRTSGLEYEIKEGKNQLDIKVTKPVPRR